MNKSLSTVFGVNTPAQAEIEGDFGPGSNYPVDDNYVFRISLLRLLNIWWSGEVSKYLYLFGPTGSGKSTVIEQFGARMQYPVFRIGVHNRLEYNETLGTVNLVPLKQNIEAAIDESDTGSEKGMMGKAVALLHKLVKAVLHLSDSAVATKFIHAEFGQALVSSRSHKVIVLIDEVDQGHPSQNMAWNKLLDGCPLTLPTGEIVDPKNVWVAATGNTAFEDERGLYRGTQRQNIAFKSRFGLHEEIDYPEKEVEEAILAKVAPEIDPKMRSSLVDFANEMRKLFVNCELDVPLATRTLINWSRLSVAMEGIPGISPFKFALEKTFSNQCSSEDKVKIAGASQRFFGA